MSDTRHIVYVNEFFHPDICASADVISEQLPRLLVRRPDLKITVITGNRAWDDPDRIYPAEGDFRGVHVIRVPRPMVNRTSLMSRARGFAAFGRGAARAARRLDRIDLVVGTTAPPQGGRVARKIAEHHGCPFIYRVLDLYPDIVGALGRMSRKGPAYRVWKALDTGIMKRAAAIVAVCEPMTRRIAETRGVAFARLHTLHDGFDPDRLVPPDRNEFSEEHNPGRRFVVQYAGNMGLSHPFEAIVGAVQALSDQKQMLFQFVGDGPQRSYLQAHNPTGNAQLLGYQPADRLAEVLSAADVCLISQHPDVFDQAIPYKIYATLAAGKPAVFIGDRRSEIADWLIESGGGLHVPSGDVKQLVRVLRDLASDRQRVVQMGAAARALFDRRFHADQVAEKWSRIIDGALDASR
ncbi:MAG: glycosyltransferase family 4 protein [Planctomycetota bacterium]|nr:glycosyltransferase family 4 protein [Planctomycetota bacterium]